MNLHRPDAATPSSDPIGDILRSSKTIAVVGLSSNPFRPSHEVAAYLRSAGYRVIPVNPNESEVLGIKAFARLEDIPEGVDIVDVFRRSEEVPTVADSAIAIGAKVLWLQQDITNAAAAEKARAAGLTVVEDACVLVEHKRRNLETGARDEKTPTPNPSRGLRKDRG
jgi:predicted CoA-binding protein